MNTGDLRKASSDLKTLAGVSLRRAAIETRKIAKKLKDDTKDAKKAPLENSLSVTLEGKQPISSTVDEAAIEKTDVANKKEPFLVPKEPDDKPSSALKRRIKPMIPKYNYKREYFKL